MTVPPPGLQLKVFCFVPSERSSRPTLTVIKLLTKASSAERSAYSAASTAFDSVSANAGAPPPPPPPPPAPPPPPPHAATSEKNRRRRNRRTMTIHPPLLFSFPTRYCDAAPAVQAARPPHASAAPHRRSHAVRDAGTPDNCQTPTASPPRVTPVCLTAARGADILPPHERTSGVSCVQSTLVATVTSEAGSARVEDSPSSRPMQTHLRGYEDGFFAFRALFSIRARKRTFKAGVSWTHRSTSQPISTRRYRPT